VNARTATVAERLTHVLSHELRIRIVEQAQQRPTISAAELAAELDAPIGNVSYHVRRLCALRVLELDHETRSRGAVCRHYRLSTDGARVGRRGALLHAVRDVAQAAEQAVAAPDAPVQAFRRAVGLDGEARAVLTDAVARVARLADELEAATRLRGGLATPVTLALLVTEQS
jgi:hypothetical protein